ncbi:MAG: hypothetical protein WCW87_02770 [Candidatus Paceibacterota bacterium]
MNTKNLTKLVTLGFLTIASAFFINIVIAQTTTEITGIESVQYPVKELGNCKDKAACKTYCDNSAHMEVCLNFAEKNNLMSKEDLSVAKKFKAAGNKGPGGCKDKNSCEQYCNDMSHIDECVSFAEKNDIMPPDQLEEAKKVQKALTSGIKPLPCNNKKECDTYCNDSSHMEACIAFGEAAGFIQGKELEDAKKMVAAVKKGAVPPPCNGKEACDVYCNDSSHMEVCMNFAIEAGFMSDQEKADSQKVLAAIKKGVKMPNCKGKEACDAYCGAEEHFDECSAFAEAAGFMTPEEATMAKKTKGKGPGGCKNKQECDAFCNNPDNQQTCFDFGKENGLISPEDLKRMEEGTARFNESLKQAPPEVLTCLEAQIGTEAMNKLKSGSGPATQSIGDKIRTCFESNMKNFQNMTPPGQGGNGSSTFNGGMMKGLGGCSSPEECQKYCESNKEECANFRPQGDGQNQIMPGAPGNNSNYQQPQMMKGPGGCSSPEECQKYCESNQEECKNFGTQNIQNQMAPGTSGSTSGGYQMQQTMKGPGGCSSPEECQKYCESNPTNCGAPAGSSGGPVPPTTMIKCEGENCPQMQPPQENYQQYQQPPQGTTGGGSMPSSGEMMQPPSNSTTGGEGQMMPANPTLMQSPQPQMQPPPPMPMESAPPVQTPPPPPEPTSPVSMNTLYNFGASVVDIFKTLLLIK